MPPRSSRDEPGESFRELLYERLGVDPSAPPRRRLRRLFFAIGGVALTGIFALLINVFITYVSAGPATEEQHKKEQSIDAAAPPFTVSVQPEENEPETWAMILDRGLSAEEQRKLTSTTDSSATFSYLKSLGGRPVAYAPVLENDPHGISQGLAQEEFADVFRVHILSKRTTAVLIDDWDVVDRRCRPSTAKTVVGYPPQGGGAYEGIRTHLPPKPFEPILTDPIDGQGESYFSVRRIEVGNGQPSAGLRVEAIAPRGQVCDWGIRVHYVDAHQNDRRVRLTDAKGRPLRIRTESVPATPQQSWVFGSVPWTACHDRPPQGTMCEAL